MHATEFCRTCEGATSHICMSDVAHMKKSCQTYEGVIPHGTVSYMHEARRTYEGVMSHILMSHVARMNESHVTYIKESCHV